MSNISCEVDSNSNLIHLMIDGSFRITLDPESAYNLGNALSMHSLRMKKMSVPCTLTGPNNVSGPQNVCIPRKVPPTKILNEGQTTTVKQPRRPPFVDSIDPNNLTPDNF